MRKTRKINYYIIQFYCNNNMVQLIYCANLTYKFIYPILFGLAHYILSILWTINDNISKDKIDKGEIP